MAPLWRCIVWAVSAVALAATAAQAGSGRGSGSPPLRCHHPRCQLLGVDNYTRYYYDVDGYQILVNTNVDHYHESTLSIFCNGERNSTSVSNETTGGPLESAALPRAERPLRVSLVRLTTCPLPARGALAAVLAALDVTLRDAPRGFPTSTVVITLRNGDPPPNADFFTGLDHLSVLDIYSSNVHSRAKAQTDYLAPLRSLKDLTLALTTYELPVMSSLTSIQVRNWRETRPAPVDGCDSLVVMQLQRIHAVALPENWLARCSNLVDLNIDAAPRLVTLAPSLLLGASALTEITFKKTALETLPPGLLDHSPQLTYFGLQKSLLKTLPNGIFNLAQVLRVVDLSGNQLETSAVAELAPLVSLEHLHLEDNTALGDVCEPAGYSPLRNLTNLKALSLRNTSVSRVCRDWREDMPLLELLSLSYTRVTELSFDDLQFTKENDPIPLGRISFGGVVMLDIYGCNLTTIHSTEEDYQKAARGQASNVLVSLASASQVRLRCDCRMYWTRRALQLGLMSLGHLHFLNCSDGRSVTDVAPEEMTCAEHASGGPELNA